VSTKGLLLTLVLLLPLLALGQEQTSSFTLEVSGQKTWTVNFGLGAPELLAQVGLSPGQLQLDQSLQAEITGTALGFITLEASFNDQLGPGFQHFLLTLDQPPWQGEVGDFQVGQGNLGIYNKKVLGVRATYDGEGFSASFLAARLQGISESRVFRGQAASAEVLYSFVDPERPWEPAPYSQNLDGAHFWPLTLPFVEGFSAVALVMGEEGLEGVLSRYGLEYLAGVLGEEPRVELPPGQYLVLRDEGDVLLLKVSRDSLLRGRIQDAIEAYNDLHQLPEEEAKRYPFVLGSELEREFLAELAALASLEVDGEFYPLATAGQRRYYLLGEKDVLEDSLELWVRLPGEGDFRPLPDPALPQFSWKLFAEEGVLEVSFPAEFFQGEAALKVAFQYRRTGETFMLGLSVVPGSERVYLNGELLQRGVDYTIDYEVGLLVLFRTLGEKDELRVDFERQRGGLGGYAEYERVLLGASFELGEGLELTVYRAVDLGRPGPSSRYMPNTHTAGGISLAGESAGWRYRLTLGASENLFPPGLNERLAAPNQVNHIALASAPDGDYLVFAHQNGLTVYHDGRFTSYGVGQGLGGRRVRSLLAFPGKLLCATDAGLTLVALTEPAPFDRVGSWTRIQGEPFPGEEGLALAAGGGEVFLATDQGVAAFPLAEAEDPAAWQVWPLPEGERPRTLLWTEGVLYLGGEQGLWRWTGDWERVSGVPGPVEDLLEVDGEIYVATGQGVRTLRAGAGAGWLVAGEPVLALAHYQGKLWWGTGGGLYREGERVLPGAVTALWTDQETLWAGTRADQEYRLDLWRFSPDPERFSQDLTHLEGRDLGEFHDPPPRGRSQVGALGELSLSRELGGWALRLDLGSRWPGYQPIGGQGGQDSHGLGFTARYQTGSYTLALGGRASLSNLADRPSGRLSGSLEVSLTDPQLSLRLAPSWDWPGDRLRLEFQAGGSWQGEAWWGDLTLAGTVQGPTFGLRGQLRASLRFRPLAGWEMSLTFREPFTHRGLWGGEELVGEVSWEGRREGTSWQARWSENWRRQGRGWQRTASGQLTLTWPSWSFSLGEVSPRASARVSLQPGEWDWQLSTTARVAFSQASLQLGATYGENYREVRERKEQDLSLNLRWEYTGWPGVRPSLTWRRAWELLSHPTYGRRMTEKTDATLRVSWQGEPWTADLTLTYRSQPPSLRLSHRWSWPLALGTVTVEVRGRWEEERLTGEVVARYGQPVAEGWDASLELGYLVGGRDSLDHGLYGRLSLVASF